MSHGRHDHTHPGRFAGPGPCRLGRFRRPLDPRHALATAGSLRHLLGPPGRLAALAVRQQADHDPAWNATLDQRDLFDLLLEATLPSAMDQGVPADQPVRWRAAGWTEMADLLGDLVRGGDAARARRAQAALAERIAD